YYSMKKLLRNLSLPVEKIDVCKNACMLYKKDNIDLDYCKFCGEAKYKSTREQNPNHKKTSYSILSYLTVTPRLQRLYASEATAEQITLHANNRMEERSMCHPFDSDASRHFYRTYPCFAVELHNVRLCFTVVRTHVGPTGNFEFDDESDEDSFEEDYEIEEDNNYD
ncbi:UNVERIFIED_CONTAM: hypothetical protein Sindi_1837300, partial [Sesamum indicum]